MARQRKLTPEKKAFVNSLIEHYRPKYAHDVQETLSVQKHIFSNVRYNEEMDRYSMELGSDTEPINDLFWRPYYSS